MQFIDKESTDEFELFLSAIELSSPDQAQGHDFFKVQEQENRSDYTNIKISSLKQAKNLLTLFKDQSPSFFSQTEEQEPVLTSSSATLIIRVTLLNTSKDSVAKLHLI